MWSLFPQTSSSNLNNNLYLPLTPGQGRPRDSGAPERPSAEPRVPGLHRGLRPALPQTPEARRGSARGKGRGAGGWARALGPSLPRGSRACSPQPQASAPSRSRASPCGRDAPRYLGSDPAGRSPRRCHSALCETDTQPQLETIAGRSAPDARLASPNLRPGAKASAAAGGGHRVRRAREASGVLPRIRRFLRERPRPIAAILTGFSHNTGNLARSRENPLPLPARRSRPPSSAPPPAAPPPLGTEARPRARSNAVPTRGGDATPARGHRQGVGAQAWWEARFPRGIPIDVARDSGARAAEAGMRAGHLLDRPAALPAWL